MNDEVSTEIVEDTVDETEDTRTYEVVKHKETLRVTVPAGWKVTFGPGVPGNRYNQGGAWCLRFYESKEKQRAIFTDVISFRDISIPVKIKNTKVEKNTTFKKDANGHNANEQVRTEEEWLDA